MAGYKLSEGAVKATAKVVGDSLRQTSSTPQRRGKSTARPGTRYWGKLITALAAPADGMLSPTTAMVQVWRPDPDSSVSMIEDDDIGEIEVVNRDPRLEANAGSVCRIEFLNGEWGVYWLLEPQTDSGDNVDCPCFDCIEAGSVDDCGSLESDATSRYVVTMTEWDEFPEIVGQRELIHDSGCIWETEDIVRDNGDDTTSTYRLRLDASTGPVSLSLVHVDGDDVVSPLTYHCVREFDPLCPNKFQIVRASQVANKDGLSCELCVKPGTACEDYGPFPAAFRLRMIDPSPDPICDEIVSREFLATTPRDFTGAPTCLTHEMYPLAGWISCSWGGWSAWDNPDAVYSDGVNCTLFNVQYDHTTQLFRWNFGFLYSVGEWSAGWFTLRSEFSDPWVAHTVNPSYIDNSAKSPGFNCAPPTFVIEPA